MAANDVNFDLYNLYKKQWGGEPKFAPEIPAITGDTGLTRAEQSGTGAAYYGKDHLGQEYFMPVEVTFPDDSADSGLISGTQTFGRFTASNDTTGGLLKTWNLPYPIVTITSRKHIVETPLTERRGTVKELINIEGYEITIRGFIIGDNNEFPEADVVQMRSLYEQNVPITLKSAITDIFLLRADRNGKRTVVIKELDFPALKGVKNVKPYELKIVSDEDFNLEDIS